MEDMDEHKGTTRRLISTLHTSYAVFLEDCEPLLDLTARYSGWPCSPCHGLCLAHLVRSTAWDRMPGGDYGDG
jgi:hypothetical protein